MKINKKLLAKKLRLLGNFLIIFGILFIVFTFGPATREETTYQIREVLNKKPELIPPNEDFSIVIPKIAAVAPVFPNIDPFDKSKYLQVLYKGVAHAKGTPFPGQEGNTYLFAHSTDTFINVGRYNAVFYLLGKLEKGDKIDIYYKGEKIEYEVTEKKIVPPSTVEYLGTIDEGRTLTLQTCYPPGTTLKRLVVIAKQI
jgi:sortase A